MSVTLMGTAVQTAIRGISSASKTKAFDGELLGMPE
jgi:hypothetical protein